MERVVAALLGVLQTPATLLRSESMFSQLALISSPTQQPVARKVAKVAQAQAAPWDGATASMRRRTGSRNVGHCGERVDWPAEPPNLLKRGNKLLESACLRATKLTKYPQISAETRASIGLWPRIVIPVVVGSSPISHPKVLWSRQALGCLF